MTATPPSRAEPFDHNQQGGAWIFTRNGKVWSQQGPRLQSADVVVNQSWQGYSVAISADGNTVLIGGPRERPDGPFDGTYPGAAWVFTRVAGVWSPQGAKLQGTGASGNAEQGTSVALSADGNTAIIGGPADDGSAGAAWIFTRSGDTWTQQGSKLVGFTLTGSFQQGYAVALSGDGNTAIVGAPGGTDGGSAFVFTRDELGAWTQQNQFLAFGAVGAFPRYGASVALSYDGNTAVIGAPQDASDRGAAFVYVRALDEWSQQGGKLVGITEENGGNQATSVSLSADGNTLVVGGPTDHPEGAIWVFARNELGAWSQQGPKLVGSNGSSFFGPAQHGRAVAISGDATTIVEAGAKYGGTGGAVWPFAKAVPTIATYSGNGQSAQINTAFSPLSVIVRDAADQPSSNVSVTFVVQAGPTGASGSFASSATVLTNANGIATAPALTANGTIGGFTVTATTLSAPAKALFDLANAAMAAPANVTATATPIPTVVVNWSPVSGATSYEVMRSDDLITYSQRAITSETSFVDSSQISFSAKLYKVRVVEPALSGYSAPDLVTIFTFTDAALDGMPVKAVHHTELRQAVNAVRGFAALDTYTYTNPNLDGEPVKAVDLTELRAALDEARGRLMLPALIYTRPVITPGSTAIAKSDVLELRGGVE